MNDVGVVNLREKGFSQLYTNKRDSFQRHTSSVVVRHAAHPCDGIDGEGSGEPIMTLMAYGQYDDPQNKNFAMVLCCWIVT
jgi:hypothetical protein